MNRSTSSILASFLALAAATAHAGAPAPETRVPGFALACKGGANKGVACVADGECPRSTCVISALSGPGAVLAGTILLTVDDDVSTWNNDHDVFLIKALTVVIDVKRAGVNHILSQTFQNVYANPDVGFFILNLVTPPFLADSQAGVSETTLATSNSIGSMLSELLFQAPESELAAALRAIGPQGAGTPYVASVSSLVYADHRTNGIASAIKAKVKIRFAP